MEALNDSLVEKAAIQFGNGRPVITRIGTGLINATYRVTFPGSAPLLLQCINSGVFPQPENVINNYLLISQHLSKTGGLKIPAPMPVRNGHFYWIDETNNRFWRATTFIESNTVDIPGAAKDVYAAANAFANFTRSLQGLAISSLEVIIPHFHDLAFRYDYFEESVRKAPVNRLLKSTHVISEIRGRAKLLSFYKTVKANETDFPTRIMHHDCKISNILFDKKSNTPICPIDLDTVMPGKYFSDIGDMIRTMACTEDENSVAWEAIAVRENYYQAAVSGYLAGMDAQLTHAEKKNIHQSGLLMTLMQCIRFVTDFLNNDVYYTTTYPEQNLNRALNQLILLEKLETFTADL